MKRILIQVILLFHIPSYMIYFIYKIKSVKGFVFVEMKKVIILINSNITKV